MEDVSEIGKSQLELIQSSKEGLKLTDRKVEQSTMDSKLAGEDVKKASRHRFGTLRLKITAIFAAIGGVTGAVFGAGVGGVVGAGAGGAVGNGIGKKLEKLAKKKILNIEFEGTEKQTKKE